MAYIGAILVAAVIFLLVIAILDYASIILAKRAGRKEAEFWRKQDAKIYDTVKPDDKKEQPATHSTKR